MMKNLLLCATLCLISFSVSAKTFGSILGISFDLGDDWLALGSKQVDDKNRQASLDALEKINIKGDNAQQILARIRASGVDYIYDIKSSGSGFNNNISLQRGAGSTARTKKQAESACKTLQADLSKIYKAKVNVTQCGMSTIDNHTFMSYTFTGVVADVTTIQHEFQITPNLTFVTIAASNADAAVRIRDAQKKIDRAIIKNIKSSPNYFKAYDKAKKALEQKKYETALKQFKILSKVSDPVGLFNIAYFHENGIVVKKDLKKAFTLYRQAANAGHAVAITKVGEFYLKGIGTEKSPEMAAQVFFQAGMMGDPVAQYAFANMLMTGEGVKKKDPQKAMQWYIESASRGYPPAAQTLIKIYEAEIKNNNIKAYHPLAMIYLQGIGVKADTDKGMKMLEKAAFDGVEESRKALYEIYSKGLFGVTKNEEKANAWKQ